MRKIYSMTKVIENASRLKIYNLDGNLKGILRRLQAQTSKENWELIQKYDQDMTSESLAIPTRLKHLNTIYTLNKFYDNKDWKNLTKEDAKSLVAEVNRKYSPDGQETNTTWDHKKILKIFIRWVVYGSRSFSEVGDPEATKWIKLKKVKDRIAREDLLTQDDLNRLLRVCSHNPRDYALIHVHYEGGTRPGEILNLKIKHVMFDEYGAKIKVDGKTGSRQIRLVESEPSLKKWINAHPERNNPEAPLWPSFQNKKDKRGKALAYPSFQQILKKRCQEAGLDKRVYPNLFRHSEATRSAKSLNENLMKQRHGWTSDSKMASRYTHLNQDDLDSAILENFGIVSKDYKEIPFKVCPACKYRNNTDVEYCESCTKPLDLKTAIQQDEKKSNEIEELKQQVAGIEKSIEKKQKILEDNITQALRGLVQFAKTSPEIFEILFNGSKAEIIDSNLWFKTEPDTDKKFDEIAERKLAQEKQKSDNKQN